MSHTRTALAALTDEGKFEELATAVLRIAESKCAGLSHPGTNPGGQTVKSPVDGVCYVPGDPNHIVIAHHTISKALRSKWMSDPQLKGSGNKRGEAGDVVKVANLIAERRANNPSLLATLFLTSTREADEPLVSDVVNLAAGYGISVEFWTGSRLAHFLDTDPDGQWIRRISLGINQELLSADLLRDACVTSVQEFRAGDDTAKRVPLSFLEDLRTQVERRRLTFVAAPSGYGKSVACHQVIAEYVEEGGFGLVLDHRHLEEASSLEQAIGSALRALEPSLSDKISPFALIADDRPLLVVVEDVSRSREPGRMLERLLQWSSTSEPAKRAEPPVRLICPVWPQLLALVSQALQNQRDGATWRPPPTVSTDAEAAVAKAADAGGQPISAATAARVARALGNDLLLIGLNSDWAQPQPVQVIRRFVEAAILKAAEGSAGRALSLSNALSALGRQMIARVNLSPSWPDVLSWGLGPTHERDLISLFDQAEVARLSTGDAALHFRHDRVKAWILVEAAKALLDEEAVNDELISEPALAEVWAGVLVDAPVNSHFVDQIVDWNPLSLFVALGDAALENPETSTQIITAADRWLERPASSGSGASHLRWEAMNALYHAKVPGIVPLIDKFPKPNAAAQLAKVSNGDIEGGLAICQRFEFHTAASWLPPAIAAAADGIAETLADDTLAALAVSVAGSKRRENLLNFAGILGGAELLHAIRKAWNEDLDRDELLRSYFWAFARCTVASDAGADLAPILERWAAMPAPEKYEPSSRVTTIWDFAADDLKWAFQRLLPERSFDYLLSRGRDGILAWPIQYMVSDWDHPTIVTFIAQVLADTRRRSTDAYFTSSLRSTHMRAGWDEELKPLSPASRRALELIWTDESLDEHSRLAAFDWWTASRDPKDLARLRKLEGDPILGERALRSRLERSDPLAQPALIEKLKGSDGQYWWWFARHSPSAGVIELFEDRLKARSDDFSKPESDLPHIFAELLTEMRRSEADRLLTTYWPTISRSGQAVLLALYVGTPTLLGLADAAVQGSADKKTWFEHLGSIWGLRHTGRSGVTRSAQIEALAPYFALLDETDLHSLADCCNEHGWFGLRRRLLDGLLPDGRSARTADEMIKRFDNALAERFPINFELDRALEAGLSKPSILGALSVWLPGQATQRALDIASETIVQLGRRSDVEILNRWNGEDIALADALTDTRFAVARRV